MDWKTNLICQIKDHKRHCNIYDEIIAHYNRLLESNVSLHAQNTKLNHDVKHLRLANVGLEKASEASQGLANISDKLNVANEELMMHLREKGELAREVLRLNLALTTVNDKLAKEELRTQQYRNENDLLTSKIEKSEVEVNELVQINEITREERLAAHIQLDQLQADYSRIHPTLLELQQQLDSQQRLNKKLEEKLMESKRVQMEMLDAEVKRYDKQFQSPNGLNRTDEDRSSTSSVKYPSDSNLSPTGADDRTPNSSDEGANQFRRPRTNSSTAGVNIFSNFKRMFALGNTTPGYDNLNRAPTYCLTASVPTRVLHQWDCTELEVYSLQFHPSGSLLATGCSDKMIHLWEIASAGQPRKYCSLQGSHGAINALDFDHEGFRLLAGCSGDKLYIWSYGDYRSLKDTFAGHEGQIYTCKFISGTKVATGSADRLIKVWDLHGRQCTRTLFAGSKCHDLVVTDAAGTIISGHFDRKIRIWDPYTDKCRTELAYAALITSLSYNAEKQQLLACLKDDTLQLIDLRQNRVIYSFSDDLFQVSTDTNKAILSPDGRYACAGTHNGSLLVWNTTNGVCEKVLLKKHTTMVTSVAWHPEGRYVASCEKHRQVILWSD